jgi:fibronectin type 3 domain-containing protein
MGWSQRSLPTDFYQGVGNSIYSTYPSRSGAWGVSWEYVILLANATNKDVWINVPINATGSSDPYDPNYVASPDTSSYVYNLAMLFKNGDAFTGNKGLNSGLHIYLEDSNEVWNSGFLQYGWNENAAEAEVNAAPGGVSVLNNDGNTSSLTWAYRRHIKRVKEIAQIFEGVFGSGSFGTTIRPVYAWWQLDEGSGSNAAAALAWFNTNYGAPSNYIYSMAQGDYFTASNYANDTTVADVLSDMSSNSSASVQYVTSNLATANQYGLHLAVYEGGPDNSNGGNQNTVNVGPQILANRTPEMDTLVQTHVRNNYFEQGGYTFGYFALSSAYSRYGDYGATDDYRILTTSKYNAIVNLTGYEPAGLPFSPGDLSATAGNESVALSWETVPGATSYNVLRGTTSGGETQLATVSSSTSTYDDTAVTNGTTYYYEITGVNSTGTGAPSNEASAAPATSAPPAPNLTATPGNSQVTLSWTTAAGATSYNVYEGTSSGGESTTPIATGVTATTYTVTGLTNGSTYYFEVAGVNSIGTGTDSNQASATPALPPAPPAAPTGLTASAGNAQATLSWNASSGATSYNVYQGTTSGGESSTPIATGITATTYTVTGLTNGTTYFFTVAAVDAAGASGYSNQASVTPAAPSALLAYEPFGESTAYLSDASGGGDSGWSTAWTVQNSLEDTPGYDIVSTNPLTYTGLLTTGSHAIGGDSYVTAGRPLNVSSSGPFASYLSSGLIGESGQTIWLSFLLREDANSGDVAAVLLNANGGGSSWDVSPSNIAVGYFGALSETSGNPFWSLQYNTNQNDLGSASVIKTSVPMVVGQPALMVMSVTFGATTTVNLYVNPSSLGGSAPATPSATYSTTSSLAFQSLAYYGGNGVSESSLGDIRVGATYASVTPSSLPAAPTGLTATAGNGQVALSWSASSGATSYNVYQGTLSGGESSTPIATGITTTTHTVTGLTNGTPYYFTVAAVNNAGASGFSNEVTATPSIEYSNPTPIDVPNYSFELDNESSYIIPQDWILASSGTSSVVQQICSNAACDLTLSNVTGTYYWSPGVSNSGTAPYGSGTATLTTSTSLGSFGPNEQYVLTVALGAANPAASQVGFELLAGGTPVATFVAPTSGTNAITSTGLTNYSLTFSTVSNPSVVGENITVALVYTYTGQYLRSAYFDDVQLTQALEVGAPPPSAPTSLTATAGNGQVALTWASVAGGTSYNVYEGTASGGEGTTPIATGVDTYSYTATGLTNGNTYYFVVTAVNADGVSGVSNEVSATPEASLGIPAAPTGLTATAGDMQAALSWTAVPGASTYNIYQGSTSGGESTTPVVTGVTTNSYAVTGLTDGTTYYFKVAAVNSYGTSGLSNEAHATPAPSTPGTNSAASFSIYPQVVAAHPVPSGFSIAPSAGTDIGENAWLADGGFNAYDERMSLTADEAGTATTFICENAGGGTGYYQSISSGFFVGATARTYRYSGGAWSLLRTDTVTGYTAPEGSDTPTAANSTITFAESGPATEAGDIIWLYLDDQPIIPSVNQLNSRFTVYYPTWQTETQNGESASLTWPYTLSTNVPSSDSGGLSLEITDTNTETQGIWQYIQGAFVGPADEEFQPGHTYEFDVWLMQSGVSSGDVTVTITGIGVSHTFTGVNGTWQHFTYTFAAPAGLASGSSQPTVRLDYSAPGTLWVDNFQLYDTGWAPNTVDPAVMTAWQDYKPGTVRIWSNFSNSGGGYSFWGLNSWLTPEIKSHNTAGIGNEYAVSVQLEHLPDALANVKAIGTANPWLIVNMSLSEVEWGELIDYLAAPAGTGYASMRPASHPGPYTADFNTIYLEVGNEEWGTQQVPADTAYGQWANFVMSNATAGKSYFNPSQIKFIVNGFVLNPGFGSAAIAAAPQASYTEAALYSNGNTSLSGDPYYQSDLVQLPVTNGPLINALVSQQQLDASNGRVYGLAAYEEGPGNSTNPGDNTLAAAIGAIDVNFYAAQSGFGPENFFLYNLGTGPWTSHSNFANGFYPHPVWEAYQMRNNYTSGPIVLTDTNSVPTYSDPTITNGQAVPLIAVYTFADANVANQADVVVISRSLDNDTPVTLNFPATPTGTANLYTLTGDPRQTNDTALNIPIGSTTVSGVTKSYTFTMPPGSMYILQVPMTGAWSSSGEPVPPVPTSLSASAGNAEVTLTWAASEGATGYNVLRGTVTGGPYTQIGTSTSVAYTDTTVTNGTTYYYVVQATNPGGASGNSPQATATPNVEDDSSTSTPPPLTGADTGAWTNVSFVPLSHYFSGSSTDTAQYKTLWDSNYLYLLVSVQDSYLIAPTQADIYDGETVEVYFSGTDTKSTTYGPTDFQYAFPYGNGGAVVTETYHSPSSLTGVIFGQQNITGGYQMAMALPWTTLGTSPVAGQQYGFDVMIDTANTQGNLLGKLAWWATVNDTWDNPSLMGPLVLSGASSPPAAPTGLTATGANGQAVLSWTASSGATSYNIYEGTSSGGESSTPIATGITATSYTVTGLTNGTAYYFKVAAVSSGGTSAKSNEASVTPLAPPTAPTGLTATAGGGQVALSWTASSGATSYNVYQGTTSGGESSTPVATGITATSYTVAGLTNGTAYYFKVAAVNSSGVSSYSSEASATPEITYGTPVAITVPNYSFELDNESNYIVPQDWTVSASGGYAQDVCSNAGCSLSLTGVTGTYYWAPYAEGGSSAPYGTEVITLTTASSLGTFAANTQYGLTVSLAASEPATSAVGMELLANGNVVASFVAPTTGTNAISSSGFQNYSLTFTTVGDSSVVGENITVALVYTYTGQYGRSAYFDNVRLTQALENGLVPQAPTGLTATAGNGQVALSWIASAGAASYNVYQGTAAGGENSTPVATGVTATSYTVGGLTDGTTYYFKVAAVNSSGVSGFSNEASAIPQFTYGSPTPITVPNYSFELNGESNYIVPEDWSVSAAGGYAPDVCSNAGCSLSLTGVTGTYYWAPYAEGGSSAPYGTETITLTTASSLGTFASDAQYVLTVSLGAANPAASAVGMELLANGNVVASFVAPTTGSNALSSTALQNYSLTFSTAGYSQLVGENITVALVYTYTGQYGRSAYFDDVQLTQAAAE